MKHKDDRALADLNESLRLEPKDPQVLAARGHLHVSRMRLDEALADANEAIRLAPTCPDGFAVRAGVLNWRHEYDKAIADLDQAIRLDPMDADSYCAAGLQSGPEARGRESPGRLQ